MNDSESNLTADDYKVKGNELLGEGRAQEAVEAYTKAIEADPNQHVFYSNRSAAYFKLGDAEAAKEDAQRCVELAPDWPKGYNRLAVAYLKLEDPKQAIKICDDGLAVDPSYGPLKQTKSRGLRDLTILCLLGHWHGSVADEIGGYEQEFEFINDEEVKLTVLGTQVDARYAINMEHDPPHLDMHIPEQPELPVVRHIFKFEYQNQDDETPTELHLCSPYLAPPEQRPTEFSGPSYIVMKRGKLEMSEDDLKAAESVSHLSDNEKITSFLKEAISQIPHEFCLPVEGDSDNVLAKKMTHSVRFQNKYQKLRNKYTGDIESKIKMMVTSAVEPPTEEIGKLVEEFRQAMQAAGLFGNPEEVAKAQKMQESIAENKKNEEAAKKNQGNSSQVISEKTSSKIENKVMSSSSTFDLSNSSNVLPLLAAAATITAIAATAVYLFRRNRQD